MQSSVPGRTPQRGGASPGGRGRGRGLNSPVQIHENSGVPHGHVPSYLPGSSSLVEEVDSRVMIILKDGTHVLGFLSAFDQYGNCVLTQAVQREIVVNKEEGKATYHDIPLGLYTVRGELIVILGRVGNASSNTRMEEVDRDALDDLAAKHTEQYNWDFDADMIA